MRLPTAGVVCVWGPRSQDHLSPLRKPIGIELPAAKTMRRIASLLAGFPWISELWRTVESHITQIVPSSSWNWKVGRWFSHSNCAKTLQKTGQIQSAHMPPFVTLLVVSPWPTCSPRSDSREELTSCRDNWTPASIWRRDGLHVWSYSVGGVELESRL